MPWKTESVMEQRLSFVIAARNQEANLSELSRRYGVSRQTGHKWLKRYQTAGSMEGRRERSRRPQHSPRRTNAKAEQQVLAIRDEKGWGADKIQYVVAKAGLALPATQIHRLFTR